ncbi:MAG: hypothetical protein H7A00_08345 [Hahellaceae bacterium]|nr:hypothetical protein [Hahellaceae bacterium]
MDHSPLAQRQQVIWSRIAWIPSVAAIIWIIIASLSFHFNLGGDDIPIDTVISMVLAELLMVISGLGVLAFFRLHDKTPRAHKMLLLNISILVGAGLVGLKLFLGL